MTGRCGGACGGLVKCTLGGDRIGGDGIGTLGTETGEGVGIVTGTGFGGAAARCKIVAILV